MRRHEIAEEPWGRIKDFLPDQPDDPRVTASDNRLFVNAVLWVAKTGAPWRYLPERFGNWNLIWRRLDRWSAKGVWLWAFKALKDPDLKWLILDSTIIRTHQHSAGAAKKAAPTKRWDAVRGGFRTKLHTAVDGLGNPVESIPTGEQEADINHCIRFD